MLALWAKTGGGGGTPLSISGTPVTTVTTGSAYAGFSVSGAGGTAPYTYSVFSGSLPPGLTLNSSTGAVSGTSTAPGVYSSIVLRVTDALSATADLAGFTISSSYTGLIATRTRFGTISTGGSTFVNAMCRTSVVIQDTVSSFKVVVPNWMIGIAAAEVTGGGNLTISDMAYSLNNINGSRTRITFNGGSSASSAAAPSTNIVSDSMSQNLVPGDVLTFWFWMSTTGTKMQYLALGGNPGTYGDTATAGTAGTPATNVVMAGSMSATNLGTNGFIPVAAVIGTTTNKTVCCVGDSWSWGIFYDFMDSDGRLGLFGRSIGSAVPFTNFGSNGSRGFNYVSDHPGANALMGIMSWSHVYNDHAINDIIAGQTAAQVVATHQTIAALFPSWTKQYMTTCPPFLALDTAVNGYTTVAGQTADSHLGVRNTYNTSVRAGGISGITGFFEVCNYFDDTGTSGKWKIYHPNPRTITDGQAVAASNIITSPAQANYTSTDSGYGIMIHGAGVASANVYCGIDGITLTSTTASVSNGQTQGYTPQNMTTSVSPTTVDIGGSTDDGTHAVPAMWASFAATGNIPATPP